MRLPNVLVTGGCGFIGSHVVQALQTLASVRILDLAHTPAHGPGMSADIRDEDALEAAMRSADVVIHLAAISDIVRAQADPAKCIDVNVAGTRLVARYAERAGVRRLVFASSAAVYGRATGGRPSAETDEPNPSCVYGWSKLSGEKALAQFNRRGGSAISLRFFNVYGPGQRRGVVPSMLAAATAGTPLVVHGGGDVRRDFVAVRDVVRAILYFALDAHQIPGIVNVGTGTATSLESLADSILMLTKSKSGVLVDRSAKYGVRESRACTLAARRKGFTTQHSLRQGLVELISF